MCNKNSKVWQPLQKVWQPLQRCGNHYKGVATTTEDGVRDLNTVWVQGYKCGGTT